MAEVNQPGCIHMNHLNPLVFATAALCLVACGGDDDAGDPGPESDNAYTRQYGCETPATGFAGDHKCLKAPAPEDGFQLHYGPRDYADAAEMNRFKLRAGGELTDCMFLTTPNDREVFLSEYHVRARLGTHHIIVYAGPTAAGEEGSLGECELGLGMRFMAGAQSGIGPDGVTLDVPLPGEAPPPENDGHASRLPPNTAVAIQMHYVNPQKDKEILREGWVNFHYTDPASVRTIVDPVWFIGGLGAKVPPRSSMTIEAKGCVIPPEGPDEVRVMGLSAHMHAMGTGFHAYKVGLDGTRSLIYQTFDWAEPLEAQFDTVHEYDVPDEQAENEGAFSGVLTIRKGESIEYDCVYDNTSDAELAFGDKAYTGQMCNLFGFYAPGWEAPWDCYNP
jgi:hypothetical protein